MPLCDHYLQELNQQLGRAVKGFTADVIDCLLRYDWPGNVRELRHLLEAILINIDTQAISYMDLPESFRNRLRQAEDLPLAERELLLSTLLAANWNKSRAAQQLHWSRMTLYRKLAKYQITLPRGSQAQPLLQNGRGHSTCDVPSGTSRQRTALHGNTQTEPASWELPDALWRRMQTLIPPQKSQRGRPRNVDLKRITEGIFYVLRTGIPWQACPRMCFGPPSTIYYYFVQWVRAGVFDQLWAEARATANDLEGLEWTWRYKSRAIVPALRGRGTWDLTV
jgi:transposase